MVQARSRFEIINRKQCSMTVWQGLLYQHLLIMPFAGVGISYLPTGRTRVFERSEQQLIFVVLDGEGSLQRELPAIDLDRGVRDPSLASETPPSRTINGPYEPDFVIDLFNTRRYQFDCAVPTSMLTIKTALYNVPLISSVFIAIGKRHQLVRVHRKDTPNYLEALYVQSGCGRIDPDAPTTHDIKPNDLILLPHEGEFTIQNTDSRPLRMTRISIEEC